MVSCGHGNEILVSSSGNGKVMVTVKLSLCGTKQHVMKTYWGTGGISPRLLDLGTVGGEWSASRPGRFIPRERAPGTHCTFTSIHVNWGELLTVSMTRRSGDKWRWHHRPLKITTNKRSDNYSSFQYWIRFYACSSSGDCRTWYCLKNECGVVLVRIESVYHTRVEF
jgi:hypothetical protein